MIEANYTLSAEDVEHIAYMAEKYQADFDSLKQATEYFYAVTVGSLLESY